MKNKVLVLLLLISKVILAQDYPIDLKQTKKYFDEVQKICNSDKGQIWGGNLWSPILLVDKETRFVVANRADKNEILKKEGDVYIGYLPKEVGIANTSTEFAGENWMMVIYPLSENDFDRNQLCIHELYHVFQKEQGLEFEMGVDDNSHLDNMDARILMKLEWSALEQAVKNSQQLDFIIDALVFRNYRRELYPDKRIKENALENNEGIAEYTGRKIASKNDIEFKENILNVKKRYWNNKSYVRSFAYFSGLLYGYILDQSPTNWKEEFTPEIDLGVMIENSYKVKLPKNLKNSYEKTRDKYDYQSIFEFEKSRDDERQKILSKYRHQFTKDTVLVLDVPMPNVVFDPRTLVPLDNLGTVYPTIKIISEWGILQVNEGGCLFNWKQAIVSGKKMKQENSILKGEGWELELKDNWELIKSGNREYKLKRIE